jgi:hypothetical protein
MLLQAFTPWSAAFRVYGYSFLQQLCYTSLTCMVVYTCCAVACIGTWM